MTAFWESVVSNVIGTFVGAGLALLTSFSIVRHGETRNDLRLLQGLIDRLHRSRALRPNQVALPFDELDRMPVACLRYLNDVEDDPSRYIASLMTLRDELGSES